jgi:hypothetical protein
VKQVVLYLLLISYAAVPLRHITAVMADGMAHLFWLHEHLEHTHHLDHHHLEHELAEISKTEHHSTTAPSSSHIKKINIELSKHLLETSEHMQCIHQVSNAYPPMHPVKWQKPIGKKNTPPPEA